MSRVSRVLFFLSGSLSFESSPLPNLAEEHPASLNLHISTECLHRTVWHFTDGHQHSFPHTYITEPLTASLPIDAALFEGEEEDELSRVLAPQMERIGITPEWTPPLVSKLRENVKRVMKSVEKRWKVRGINVSIVYEEVHLVFESVLERAIWESRFEYENGNCGMVAADLDAVEKMMKSVRIGDKEEEECRICLEEMKEIGKSLPCGHLFHSDCILKWLQTSHYCPLCRLEMPTQD